MSPHRIQQRRTKGWRKPAGAVSVARPGRWGNPWSIDTDLPPAEARARVVEQFSRYLRVREHPYAGWADVINYPSLPEIRTELRGKDLMCWCPLVDAEGNPVPCHADVLLEIANGDPR